LSKCQTVLCPLSCVPCPSGAWVCSGGAPLTTGPICLCGMSVLFGHRNKLDRVVMAAAICAHRRWFVLAPQGASCPSFRVKRGQHQESRPVECIKCLPRKLGCRDGPSDNDEVLTNVLRDLRSVGPSMIAESMAFDFALKLRRWSTGSMIWFSQPHLRDAYKTGLMLLLLQLYLVLLKAFRGTHWIKWYFFICLQCHLIFQLSLPFGLLFVYKRISMNMKHDIVINIYKLKKTQWPKFYLKIFELSKKLIDFTYSFCECTTRLVRNWRTSSFGGRSEPLRTFFLAALHMGHYLLRRPAKYLTIFGHFLNFPGPLPKTVFNAQQRPH